MSHWLSTRYRWRNHTREIGTNSSSVKLIDPILINYRFDCATPPDDVRRHFNDCSIVCCVDIWFIPLVQVLLCAGGRMFTSPSWLPSSADFNSVSCFADPTATEMSVGSCGGGDFAVSVGHSVSGTHHELYTSCFQRRNAQPCYVGYKQEPANSDFMVKVTRPFFNQGWGEIWSHIC